jgi:hypothetical protein
MQWRNNTISRRWPTRRWLLAGAALAACSGFWALLPPDPLEAARRRVPLGADPEAVEAAVGRPADGVLPATAVADDPRRVFIWEDGDDQLLVRFDADGRVVEADVYHHWRPPTIWERLRARLG